MFRCQITGELSEPGEKPVTVVVARYGPGDFRSKTITIKTRDEFNPRKEILKNITIQVPLEGEIKKEIKVRACNLHLVVEVPHKKLPKIVEEDLDSDNSWVSSYKRLKMVEEGKEQGRRLLI